MAVTSTAVTVSGALSEPKFKILILLLSGMIFNIAETLKVFSTFILAFRQPLSHCALMANHLCGVSSYQGTNPITGAPPA